MREPAQIAALVPLISYFVVVSLVGSPDEEERLIGILQAARDGWLTVETKGQPKLLVPVASVRWIRAAVDAELQAAGVKR